MFDTYVTVVGNALNTPEWRRTTNTGAVVVSFKVASTARRLNRESGEWVDGNSLRVRVTCWRRLAEGVGASVRQGDPVIVVGRLYTREWEDEQGARRLAYEVDAVTVGHDLSKGRASFGRVKPTLGTSMVEDAQAEARAGGEATAPLPADEVPVAPPSAFDGDDLDGAHWPETVHDPLAVLRAGGLDPVRLDGPTFGDDGAAAPATAETTYAPRYAAGSAEPDDDSGGEEFEESANPDTGDGTEDGEPGRRRRRGRVPVPA